MRIHTGYEVKFSILAKKNEVKFSSVFPFISFHSLVCTNGPAQTPEPTVAMRMGGVSIVGEGLMLATR